MSKTFDLVNDGVEQRVRYVVSVHLGQDFMNDDMFAVLGADSLDAVEMIMDIEDEFKIEIHEEESDKWLTPLDVINALTSGSY